MNRTVLGVAEHLQALSIEDVRAYHRGHFVPGGSILALAGNLDHDRMLALLERRLGSWQGHVDEPGIESHAIRGYHHEVCESSQLHLGLGYDMPCEADPRSILARMAVNVLSGGASSRLYTEVREKRGLCYSVGARYGGDHQVGGVFC
ncbi:MAG: insulinase family protein [Phycisphaerales bacterium]|nr:insulinase family protein [Phycisphaerales bacterium]